DPRDVVPTGPLPIAIVGVGGLAFQDLRFEVAGPTGHGEDFMTSLGWEPNWRHISERVDMPAPGKLPGLLSVNAFFEQQDFEPVPHERSTGERRQVGANLSDWSRSWLWW